MMLAGCLLQGEDRNTPRLVLREEEAGRPLLAYLTFVLEFNGVDVHTNKVEGDGRISYTTEPMPLLAESRQRWYQDRNNPMVPTGRDCIMFDDDYTLMVWLTASFYRAVYAAKDAEGMQMAGPNFKLKGGREACRALLSIGGAGVYQKQSRIVVPNAGVELLERWLIPRVDREVWNVTKEPEKNT